MISRFRNITQANTLRTNSQKPYKTVENKTNNQSNPNFKGALSVGSQMFNFLNTNPAVGACFVDFFSMVMPRTLVDMGRSKDAGIETGIRESSGTVNHAFVGLDGFMAAALVSAGFNAANGIQAHKMFMDGDTIDTLQNYVKTAETQTGYDTKAYWESFFKDLKGMNAENGVTTWNKLSEQAVKDATEVMVNNGIKGYSVDKHTLAKVSEIILKDTGASENFKIEKEIIENGETKKLVASNTAKDLVKNANSMLKAVTDKATHDKTTVVQDLEKFLKGVKHKKLATVAAGLAIPVAIGISAQPVNRYLTKKRTGNDGFVGVQGRKPDHSAGFKLLKTGVGLGIGSLMIASILDKPMKLYTEFGKSVQNIISKLQYKGFVPTMNQFKFIYGMTIMSRFMSARDKNELRESTIKDSLGFVNWLILGSFVSKLALRKMDKNLIKLDETANANGWFSKLISSVEKSHEEILYPALKKLGINAIDENGKRIKFNKLVSKMTEKAKSQETTQELKELVKTTRKQLKFKNYAQLAGYLYSGIVLGYGIPKLNIAITKHFEKQNNTPEEATTKMKVPDMTIKPDSKTFSAFGAYLQ